ncbi:sterol carrier protein domain-containing protein, partial [uncultured Dubosiella sp.]
CTPQQNRLYELLEDRSKDSFVMIRQGMMARIVDVAAFLEQYPFAKKAEFALEILEDQYAPWNAGIYEVRHTKEMTKVKKVFATSLPCAKMDVQALVRLFFGNMDPKGIVADEKVWKILRKCLRQDVVNFSDYF